MADSPTATQVLFGILGTISGLCGMREIWMTSAVKTVN